jgi:hypothetical protein
MSTNGFRFIGISPSVDLTERKSEMINEQTEPFTFDEMRGYKVYTALLTQIGAAPPTAVVLENTLGFTPIWEYVDTGWYRSNSASFTEKTAVFLGNPYSNDNNGILTFESTRTPSNYGSVVIRSKNADTLSNNMLSNTPIEIRVYN